MVGERERESFSYCIRTRSAEILSSSNGEASMRLVLAERCVSIMTFA